MQEVEMFTYLLVLKKMLKKSWQDLIKYMYIHLYLMCTQISFFKLESYLLCYGLYLVIIFVINI
jgi:hypothetical protein